MKRTATVIAAIFGVFAVFVIALVAFATAGSKSPAPQKPTLSTVPLTASANGKDASLMCPVMKTPIPSVKEAAGKSVYNGKTYYFCCGSCKPEFDKNPAKYVQAAPPKPEPATK